MICLSWTAAGDDISFNKNRFLQFHKHNLYHWSQRDMLSFSCSVLVRLLISRQYTSILTAGITARRRGIPERYLCVVYPLSDRLCERIPGRQHERVFL
ncbi:hypothetical protein C3432_14325 [Citrobacter amalonaticus]|uniref:Uncharacterized protein n=1 Tax=Citrobacter amalonaticus TaxID=35703 RepID=A0A2S4RWA3_CITAM|nr:hypothetical protein C3432_14325 [Citrobacter amalonaticus]POT75109.1 hypothetical protein C3436_14795 [Citrobacter amalonaticus]POU64638.1 hypothetical protein C3430_15815 [Citrobacter amalonaticus]POV04474.1 hypothetical protein C3424_15135 [Citrobacter amalonaticus]